MLLRYLDTHADHRHLWQSLDQRFLPLVDPRQPADAYQRALEDCLTRVLAQYREAEPVLLVFHLHEVRADGDFWRITRPMWESWPAHERIYVLFVSGSEGALGTEWLTYAALPPTHFASWQPLPLTVTPELRSVWQDLIASCIAGAPDWQRLVPPAPSPALAWHSWRHDALACLPGWPRRQERLAQLLNQIPASLTSLLPTDWLSELQARLAAQDLAAVEQRLRRLAPVMPPTASLPAAAEAGRLAAHWQALADHWLALADVPELASWHQRWPHLDSVAALEALLEPMRELSRHEAKHATALYHRLHNGIEQHLYHLGHRAATLRACLPDGPDSERIRFTRWAQSLPPAAPVSPLPPRLGGVDGLNLLVLEDNLLWQSDILERVQATLSERQGPRLRSVTIAGDAATARQLLASSHQGAWLVIADLSIPERAGEPPHRAVGEALLRDLTHYQQQAAVIVLSTPGWLLQDQLLVQACGIADADYLSKADLDAFDEVLEQWLDRLLLQPKAHALVLRLEDGAENGEVWLDAHPLPALPRSEFQYLYLLAERRWQNHQRFRSYDAEQLFEAVHQRFPRTEIPPSLDASGLQRLEDAFAQRLNRLLSQIPVQGRPQDADVLRNQLMQQARLFWEDGESAREPFADRQLLELLLTRFERLTGAVHLHDWQARCRRFFVADDSAVLLHRTLNSHVSDRIYHLRQRLHEAQRAARQASQPDELLWTPATSRSGKDPSLTGYALAPSVTVQLLTDAAPRVRSEAMRVLLVENDPLRSQDLLKLLESYGFEVRHAPHAEAVDEMLKTFVPELTVLDLHLPLTAAAYAQDPLAGVADSGLVALAAIQQQAPETRTLVLSLLADRDDLRQRAVQSFGLSHFDFVVYQPAEDWLSCFQLHLQRLLREMRDQLFTYMAQMPLPPFRVEILKGESAPAAKLDLLVNQQPYSYSGEDARWLILLMQHAGHWIATETLLRVLYRVTPDQVDFKDFQEPIKQRLKRLRSRLRKEWFDNQVPAEVMRSAVLESRRHGGLRMEIPHLLDPHGWLARLTP